MHRRLAQRFLEIGPGSATSSRLLLHYDRTVVSSMTLSVETQETQLVTSRFANRLHGPRPPFLPMSIEVLSTNFRREGLIPATSWRVVLQVLFGEFAKLIGNGPRRSQHDRSVSDCIPSETIADHVDSAVCRPARHPSLGARPTIIINKP